MEYGLRILETYGYWAVFLAVLLDFSGAPITSIPLLVIAGALAATGKLSLILIVTLAAVAAVAGDILWYGLGRSRGEKMVRAMCGLSLDKEQCVSRSTRYAARYSASSLLVCKFIPGLAMLAPPAAGAAAMPVLRFLVLSAIGSTLWSAVFSSAGYIFSQRVHGLLVAISQSGFWSLIILTGVAAIIAFLAIGRKFFFLRKRRFETD